MKLSTLNCANAEWDFTVKLPIWIAGAKGYS